MTQTRDEPLGSDRAVFTPKTLAVLLPTVLVAAVLRLIYFGQSPPGLNQDEAVNAWNAWCLLKTGLDQYGISWPIFYYRGLGGNNTTLYMYLLMPFQIIGGMNVITTRLPAAFCGILTIPLIYYVGTRMFDRRVGLVAALLLTFNPWHIQQSRWGHEASIAPLLGLIPLALMLWARFPVGDNVTGQPKLLRALLAGTLTGIVCYGYYAIRVFVPLFLFVAVLVTMPAWWRLVKNRQGLLVVIAFILLFFIIFLPMVWLYIFKYDGIALHNIYLLKPWDGLTFSAKMANMSTRYINHFGPDFLFIRGDLSPLQSPPKAGQFHWYMLPLMAAGLVAMLLRFRKSTSVRVLFAFILVYPVSDSLCYAYGTHALRSAPGLCALVLLAALGATSSAGWLHKRSRILTIGLAGIFVMAVIVINVRYLRYFYGDYNREPAIYHLFHTDLLEGFKYLRDNCDDYDVVFCTTIEMNMPYIMALVALEHEPMVWHKESKAFVSRDEWDYYTRYGKMVFMYEGLSIPDMDMLKNKFADKRIAFIVRPGELGLTEPIRRIYSPDGREVLWLCEMHTNRK